MADDELFRDELFPSDDDDFFDELPADDDFFAADDDLMPDFGGEDDDGGGVSRTFKIIGGLILVAVVVIVLLLVLVSVMSSGEITDNERTSTAVIATNTANAIAYANTVTAQYIALQATENAIRTQEAQATATEVAFQTQEAVNATATAQSAALTATAGSQATQTAAYEATQSAENSAMLTATAVRLRTVSGQVLGEGNLPFAGVTLRLYQDDGDGTFNPAGDQAVVPDSGPAGGSDTVVATPTPVPDEESAPLDVDTITYGDTVQGELALNADDLWNFTGTAGDVLYIATVADDSMQTDMFLELVGPSGSVLATDDDSGGNFNAALEAFVLPSTGNYVIRVNSVTGPGGYTLTLDTQPISEEAMPDDMGTEDEAAPADDGAIDPEPTQESGGVSYVPRNAGVDLGPRESLMQANDDPTPTPEPQLGDALLQDLVTGTDGGFDFGTLEVGTYWIEMEYASLPPNLQALVPEGENLFIRVDVPTQGQPIIFPIGAVPTPMPSPTPEVTLDGTVGLETVTPTMEPDGTLMGPDGTPSVLPTTGFFGDISDSAGDLNGSSGLTILAIAAVGLVAVVFIARKLRTSA